MQTGLVEIREDLERSLAITETHILSKARNDLRGPEYHTWQRATDFP